MKLSRTRAIATLVVLASVLLLVGCPEKYQKAAAGAKNFAASVSAIQDAEIFLHGQGKIEDEYHVQIQQGILQCAEAGKELDSAINVLHSGVKADAALNLAFDKTQALLDIVGAVKNPESKAQLQLAILGAKNALLAVKALAK